MRDACLTGKHAAPRKQNPPRRRGFLVEVRGFEPLASSVRGKRSAGLSYTPKGSAMLDRLPDPSKRSATQPGDYRLTRHRVGCRHEHHVGT